MKIKKEVLIGLKLGLILCIALLGLTMVVSAQEDTYPLNKEKNITIDCKLDGIPQTSALAYLTIQKQGGGISISNLSMSHSGNGKFIYPYTFDSLGYYELTGYCTTTFTWSDTIVAEVTPSGEPFSISQLGVIIAFAILAIIFVVLGFAFSKEKWKQRGAFFTFALLMGAVIINSVRVLVQGSTTLDVMTNTALIATIGAVLFMFIYLLIHYTIEIVRKLKDKKERKWEVSNNAI
jgi:hypothetical protein